MNLGTGIIGGARAPLLVHVHSQTNFAGGSGNPTYTQTGCNFGSAHASRRIFLVIAPDMFVSSGGPKSVTIGGVAATLHVQSNWASGSTQQYAAIFSAAVPAGTSGTVFMSSGNGSNLGNVSFALYASYHQKNAAAFDVASNATSGAGAANISLDVPSLGFVLACHAQSNTLVCTTTMSAGQALTRDLHDQAPNTQGAWYSGSKLVPQSPMSLTAGYTNSGGGPFRNAAVAASFR